MGKRRQSLVARCALTGALVGVLGAFALDARPVAAAGVPGRELPAWARGPETVYFAETGHHLAEPFLYYWRQNGGRAIIGLPISEVITSANGGLQTQYFERMTLQFRPNSGGATALLVGRNAATTTSVNLRTGPGVNWTKVNVLTAEARGQIVGGPLLDAAGEPWYQLSGPFGTGWTKGEFLERQDSPISIATLAVDLDGARAGEPAFRRLPPVVVGALGPDTDDLTYFPSTGHSLSGEFLHFWAANGGVSLFGLPLSEPFTEINADDGKPYLTQYFEHARLEFGPAGEASGDPVRIGTLGRQGAAVARISTAAVPQRADAPTYDPALFAATRWIEVNLSAQRLTAFEGDLPVLTTLIRSGKEGWRTPTGVFNTYRKVEMEDMTLGGDPGDPDYYYTEDVPWIMYFMEGGFALHGAYWLDIWGTPTSRGCVNIPVDIAAYLYNWAPVGTIVWIHY